MYTTEKSEIAKLRAYRRELSERYGAALLRRDWAAAYGIREVRRKVNRAVLLYEEWHADGEHVAVDANRLRV
ncbi:MAG: hypothetical protein ACYC3S_04530 [Chloroflexota bacterium]